MTHSFDDCFLHDRDRLRHDEALELLEQRLSPISATTTVPLSNALGRITSRAISAPQDVPLHSNAAVDGYAYAAPSNTPLPISARIAAGNLAPSPLAPSTAARIFTGAPMPPGADTVAMQEDCSVADRRVTLPPLKPGANCRKRGEDVAEGGIVLPEGQRLRPQDMAALASIGVADVPVFAALDATLLSNGDELRLPSGTASLKPGEVFDANAPLLKGLLARLPVNLQHPPIVPDDATAVRRALSSAAQTSDVIITTAGASRGDEDHMRATLEALGTCHMWQLAVKPGRPMMFGQIRREGRSDCFVFGLPGNPVAAMVCFLLYVRPALLRLAGGVWTTPRRVTLPAMFEVSAKKADRREFARGMWRDNGIERFARDGSGLISSLVAADGLIELPEAVTKVQRGDPVAFIPFSSFD